jgi:hypothetical protein
MNDATDLITFCQERLDEDEATAKGAARTDDGHNGEWNRSFSGMGGDFDARVDDHIALHDPKRVLREVDAKRKILALHGASIGGTWCVTCDPGSDVSGDAGAWYPCLTLRTLAAVWSGHPDYDPGWA